MTITRQYTGNVDSVHQNLTADALAANADTEGTKEERDFTGEVLVAASRILERAESDAEATVSLTASHQGRARTAYIDITVIAAGASAATDDASEGRSASIPE